MPALFWLGRQVWLCLGGSGYWVEFRDTAGDSPQPQTQPTPSSQAPWVQSLPGLSFSSEKGEGVAGSPWWRRAGGREQLMEHSVGQRLCRAWNTRLKPPLATRRQSLSKSPRVKTGRLPSRCSVGSAAMGSVRPPGPSLSPRRALLAGAAAWVAQGAAASCSSGRERGKGRRAGTASFPAQGEPLLPREGGEIPDMSSEAPAGMERPGPGERVFPSEALAFPPSSPVLCREGCWEVNRSWKKSSLRSWIQFI